MKRGIMLIRIFVLKVINNERKNVTHHETIDCIVEHIVPGCETYGHQISHLLIHVSSLNFIL